MSCLGSHLSASCIPRIECQFGPDGFIEPENDTRLVNFLVAIDSVPYLIADPVQQKALFNAADRYLSYELIYSKQTLLVNQPRQQYNQDACIIKLLLMFEGMREVRSVTYRTSGHRLFALWGTIQQVSLGAPAGCS